MAWQNNRTPMNEAEAREIVANMNTETKKAARVRAGLPPCRPPRNAREQPMIETITYHNVALGDPHGGVYAEGLSAEIKHDLYTGELVKLHIGKMAMSRIEAVAMFEADAIDHLENDKHEDWLDARSAAMTDWRAAENAETQGAE